MFACFGKSKKKKNKKIEKVNDNNKEKNEEDSGNESEKEIKELEKQYLKLKVENENLSFSNENNQRQSLFLDSLIRDFKTSFSCFYEEDEAEENVNESSIRAFLRKEKSTLEAKYELLNGDNKILMSQYQEAYDELEKLTDPKVSEIAKLEQKQFILENILKQKKSSLEYLELKLQQLKKKKKDKNGVLIDDIFLNNNMPEKIYSNPHENNSDEEDKDSMSINDKSMNNSNNYHPFANQDGNRETIRKIISDNIEFNRALYQKIYRQTIDENNKYEENVKKLNQIKKEIEEIKNPQNKNINNNASNNISTDTKSLNNKNEEKDEKLFKEKTEELMKNKSIISNLLIEIEKVKNENSELEKEIGQMYEDLSAKFKSAIQLEKELEKIKNVRRKMSISSQEKQKVNV